MILRYQHDNAPLKVGNAVLEPVGFRYCNPERRNDTTGKDIRSSFSPKALATWFPLPTPGEAMDEVRPSVDRYCLLLAHPVNAHDLLHVGCRHFPE